MAPYRTYAMAFSISRGAIPDALYWDTLDPYHYVRLQPSEGRTDYLVVGGADHKTGESDDAEVRFDALEAWARNLIPAAKEVTHRWSGQVLDAIDYAAFIGRNPGNKSIYVHTGDSGQGMTHGVVGSLIKVAAYRDSEGILYARSAACIHVGCHLHWNSFEVCWDCPCHGSHFAVDGTALNAPAVSPLAEVKTQE
jgi:glycine/D-amino acid oxidase-like deaminating enzyme